MSNRLAGQPSPAKVGPTQASESSLKRKRGVFRKNSVEHMMYGFGDDPNPLPETVALVEDIVVDYVTDLVHKAQDTASKRGEVLAEDILFLIRKDLPKTNRCLELLSLNKEIKMAKKAINLDKVITDLSSSEFP